MKKCELCNSPATVLCESDQASLCWNCDARVHGANFLVAKHTRNLLCHVCQSPTPWNGSGPKLGPTVSVCNTCVGESSCRDMNNNNNHGGGDDDDEEENQVVPLPSSMQNQVKRSSATAGNKCSSSNSRFCNRNRITKFGSRV